MAGSTNATNTRYWESYLPRYLSGFIVGAACVVLMYLYYFHDEKLIFPLSWTGVFGVKPDSIMFILVAVVGMGFCYMSSTPITVFHAGRFGDGDKFWIERQITPFWTGWVISIFFILLEILLNNGGLWFVLYDFGVFYLMWAVSLLFWFVSYVCFDGVNNRAGGSSSRWDEVIKICNVLCWGIFIFSLSHQISARLSSRVLLLSIGFAAVFICIGQYMVIWRLKSEQGEKDFLGSYALLSCARQKDWSPDIREAYSHLREHSNAIFIVVCEISILCLILFVKDFIPQQTNLMIAFFLGALCIWLVPTVFIWSRANVLERDLSKYPGKYKS
jgi:hypothetical protein